MATACRLAVDCGRGGGRGERDLRAGARSARQADAGARGGGGRGAGSWPRRWPRSTASSTGRWSRRTRSPGRLVVDAAVEHDAALIVVGSPSKRRARPQPARGVLRPDGRLHPAQGAVPRDRHPLPGRRRAGSRPWRLPLQHRQDDRRRAAEAERAHRRRRVAHGALARPWVRITMCTPSSPECCTTCATDTPWSPSARATCASTPGSSSTSKRR